MRKQTFSFFVWELVVVLQINSVAKGDKAVFTTLYNCCIAVWVRGHVVRTSIPNKQSLYKSPAIRKSATHVVLPNCNWQRFWPMILANLPFAVKTWKFTGITSFNADAKNIRLRDIRYLYAIYYTLFTRYYQYFEQFFANFIVQKMIFFQLKRYQTWICVVHQFRQFRLVIFAVVWYPHW